MNVPLDPCPSCGGRSSDLVRGRAVCRFCGTETVPRLLPGSLCCETSGGPCRTLAEGLCLSCALPLCARHATPRIIYWNEPLHWRQLLRSWTDAEAITWARLTSPLPSLPVAGFEPFEWRGFASQTESEAGELESSAQQALRAETARFNVSVRGDSIRLGRHCTACEIAVREAASAVVAPLASEFRRALFDRRLDAIEAELRQALRYVEAFLRRPSPPCATPPESIPFGELTLESDASAWELLGQELRHRLNLASRLARTMLGR